MIVMTPIDILQFLSMHDDDNIYAYMISLQ